MLKRPLQWAPVPHLLLLLLAQQCGLLHHLEPDLLRGGAGAGLAAVVAVAFASALVHLANMLLEVEVAAESLAANLAGERLLLVVGVHVERQVVHLWKGF